MVFSPGTPVSSTSKTGRYDITEVLLNVALNAITLTLKLSDEQHEMLEDIKRVNKGNNKITELRTILQKESQNS